jgi:HrpA-like RNA helicase
MSATLHAKLLLDYFAATVGPAAVAPPLAVGVRRFPLEELFLEEVLDALGSSLPDRLRVSAAKLAKASLTAVGPGKRVTVEIVTAMVEMVPWVVRLATTTAAANGLLPGGGGAQGGGAVLVFVPGMAEIEEIADSLQGVPHYSFIPIHSQLPFEDQLEAFAPSPPGIIKVVVATNAAESSLTLPDVDAVIDLGLHKLLSYSTEMRSAVLRVRIIIAGDGGAGENRVRAPGGVPHASRCRRRHRRRNTGGWTGHVMELSGSTIHRFVCAALTHLLPSPAPPLRSCS